MKKRYWFGSLLAIIVLIAILTNPSEEQYLQISKERYGDLEAPVEMRIERINFLLFTAYTPTYHWDHGITHIGAFGTFFQVSDGQYDYPFWLEFFK